MDIDDWKKRISRRTDFSQGIVHLTKSNDDLTAFNVLMKILKEQVIEGSINKIVNGKQRGFICGDVPVVCFQDVPLYSLSENIQYEQCLRKEDKSLPIRYTPFGIRFSKNYIYKHGGRPVIYEDTEIAKSFLPKDEYWRIVKFNLMDDNNIVDWTHEREWRIKGDFSFELSEVEVLLSNNQSIKKFYDYCKEEHMEYIFEKIKGIVTLKSLIY
ncbi:MAG: hypothetical protein K0R34_1370 [Herbinix sp.]|jgi:hypothetical protein|nr:hypothetical protein [Herbinix sp.]